MILSDRISPPYTPDSCTGSNSLLARIQQLVSYYYLQDNLHVLTFQFHFITVSFLRQFHFIIVHTHPLIGTELSRGQKELTELSVCRYELSCNYSIVILNICIPHIMLNCIVSHDVLCLITSHNLYIVISYTSSCVITCLYNYC